MMIQNIVVVSPMYKEIKKMIEQKNVSKNFRYVDEREVTQGDVNWADAFVGFNLQADLDYSNLKWVHSLGAGVDRFLYKKQWNENVLLTRTICSFGQRISEYCLSYILMDLQCHSEFKTLKSQKKWQPTTPKLLNNQKVMVYGTGEIGQTLAKTLSSFGVEVFGVSLSGKEKEYFKEVMTLNEHFPRLREMDYLINTLPLTEQTEKLFNDTLLNQVSQVGFINVGRGNSVDEKALLQALNDNRIRFAVLDVFTQEPLPEDHEFWNQSNVWVTPHISAVTTPEEGVECFIDTLKNIEENKPLHNKVDVSKGY